MTCAVMPASLTACPQAGSGVHRWLLSQANRCRTLGLGTAATKSVLREGSQGCGRQVPDSEIDAAVRKSFESPLGPRPGFGRFNHPRSPEPLSSLAADPAAIRNVASNGFGLADLVEASPVRFEDNATEELIDSLFPGDSLLCCGWSQSRFDTLPRSEWRGRLGEMQFLVPSPMKSVWGLTKEGKQSKHTLSNTGPRRFLVIEFDSGDLDGQAARLRYLSTIAPLSLAVHSGGKSLHGWFYCQNVEEGGLENFMRRCVRLGADPATWCRSQFVRMPDGLRADGQRQQVMYFAPDTLKP